MNVKCLTIDAIFESISGTGVKFLMNFGSQCKILNRFYSEK